MSEIDLQEFVGGFIAESEQLVASATAGLLELETANARGEARPQTVRDLFRALHTLKGLAGMMGVQPIVDIAHAFETVVRAADQAGGKLGARAVELGLLAVRGIAERVRAVADRTTIAAPPEGLLDELARTDVDTATTQGAPTLATSWDRKLSAAERAQLSAALSARRAAYTLTFSPSEELSKQGVTIATVRPALAKLGEIVKVTPRAVPVSADAPAGLQFDLLIISDADPIALAGACRCKPELLVPVAASEVPLLPSLPGDDVVTPIGRSFVRVELARLDDLQEQLSALVVSRFRLEREIARLETSHARTRALREIADIQARQLRELRRGILRARMVRVSEVLEPLSLLVRSHFKPGIKEVRLVVDVGDTELDKAVADRLLPAIVHLVRNAVDHGIEPVVERERLGKSRVGQVTITSRAGGGNRLELSVADDGRGIDHRAIEQRAGRPIADAVELLGVLATPGFSTRDTVTNTSGRGLGMDIVRRAVRDLAGELTVDSTIDTGTTFHLEVPLTIAIIDVFSFECARQAFVVPVAGIEEIFELDDGEPRRGPNATRGALPISICERRGRAVPVVQLATMLRLGGDSRASKALVVLRNGEPLAFAVDRMIGRHEVVVRPLDDVLARAPGVAGATDLGDGRPTLLLDLCELSDRVDNWRAEEPS